MTPRRIALLVLGVVAAGSGGPALPHVGSAVTVPPGAAVVLAGAAVADFTPPAHGALPRDPSDCLPAPGAGVFDGPRAFAFEEPYVDRRHSGHYDAGDPFVDCNHDGRWDGNFLGGGASAPRFYDSVADAVTARALVVTSHGRSIAVEVVDQEGLFDVYQQRIRERVAADGVRLDGVFISATHDESAPDSLGLYGVNSATSSVNPYFVDWMVERSAKAVEDAYRSQRPATLRLAEAQEPANLRQCWSSYPFVDDRLMPSLQAVALDGSVVATLADVSQHAETLGFNPDPVQARWVSSDWPHFMRTELEAHYGGIAIEMAGSVGSVETPEVFSQPVSATPQHYVDESHPAGCRTLFAASGTHVPTGYYAETTALGVALAQAVETALDTTGVPSTTGTVAGARADVCLPESNVLFAAGGVLGVFAGRPGATPGCVADVPPLPNGSTAGTMIRTQVAAFRIGDAEFVSVPGEVFPFTYLRGFVGPQDMPVARYGMPPWLMPHMHTPFRFVDGLGEDMIGYIFPRGNGVGVPGENPVRNPQANDTDRFGCAHSDDGESATSQAGDLLGAALVRLLDAQDGPPETVREGRYVLPTGALSRDPLGAPEVKCSVDTAFTATGPAVAVWTAGGGVVRPAAWMSSSGRAQPAPDRDTRGYIDTSGRRVWLDVFADIPGSPASVPPPV